MLNLSPIHVDLWLKLYWHVETANTLIYSVGKKALNEEAFYCHLREPVDTNCTAILMNCFTNLFLWSNCYASFTSYFQAWRSTWLYMFYVSVHVLVTFFFSFLGNLSLNLCAEWFLSIYQKNVKLDFEFLIFNISVVWQYIVLGNLQRI